MHLAKFYENPKISTDFINVVKKACKGFQKDYI